MESLASELEQLQVGFIRFVLAFFGVMLFLLLLTPGECHFFGHTFACLVPGTPSLATALFLSAQTFLVPVGVSVVALNPVSVFLAPFSLSFLVTLLITFPYGAFLGIRFLRPGLSSDEQRTVQSVVVPVFLLFYSGAAFAFFLVIPQTFTLLYSFATPLGITPFFSLDDFLATTVLITTATGFSFLLPVGMVLLSQLGLVPGGFWSTHWRGAFLGTIIFSAIVTPDGSGMTMLLLSFPLLLLYGSGVFLARARS